MICALVMPTLLGAAFGLFIPTTAPRMAARPQPIGICQLGWVASPQQHLLAGSPCQLSCEALAQHHWSAKSAWPSQPAMAQVA
jgi:hypothetical protein